MNELKLNIKNMVCPRCITAVKSELKKLCIKYSDVKLGEVYLYSPLTEFEESDLAENLVGLGFELLSDNKSQVIERIRNVIIELIHHNDQPINIGNLSEYLTITIGQNYSSLSKLFSDVEGITIEKYAINQKIERVKELLVYDEMNVSEIAYYLNYSSSQHLSTQFKSVTGLSPSDFKKNKDNNRKLLSEM